MTRGGRNNVTINYGGENVVPNMARQPNSLPTTTKHFQKSKTSNITRKNMRLPAAQRALHNTIKMTRAANFQLRPSHITNYKTNNVKLATPMRTNRLLGRNQATRRLQSGRLARNMGTRRLAAVAV